MYFSAHATRLFLGPVATPQGRHGGLSTHGVNQVMKQHQRTPLSLCIAAGLVALTAPAGGWAQSSTPAAPPVETLETVVVTAQKRPQKLQEIPVAVSVVTAQDIENRGISGFAELLGLIPNTTIDQNTSAQPTITIRGITSSTNNIGMESGVGVVIDDVFLGRPSAFSTQLIDIERVEVLRGSQGTLFGKNTTGGLINIVTSKPSRQFAAAADLTGGSYGLRQARAYVTGGLGDDMAAKLSFTSKRRDGWVENRNPAGPDLMSENFNGVRGQLQGKAGGLSWLLSADHGRDRAVDNYYDVRDGTLSALDADGNDRSIATNGGDQFGRTIKGASLKLETQSQGINWVSITAQRGVDWYGRNDQDYTDQAILVLSRKEKQSQFSQELRASGQSGRLNWLAGLYYFRQKQDGVDRMVLDELTPVLFGLPYMPGFQEAADTIVHLDTRSSAAFGSGSYALSETVELNTGLRYTSERKRMNYRQELQQQVGLIGALAAEVAPFDGARKDAQWSGDIGLAFKHGKQLNSYLKMTRGFKAGGFDTTQATSADPGDLSFDPETVQATEVGFKSILAGGRLRLNGAAFHMDYKNKQEQFFNGVSQRVSNAARARISGAELDLTARPDAALQVGLSLGYQDATYKDYLANAGKRLVDSSRLTASLSGQYEHSVGGGWGWMIRGDIQYRSKSYQQPDNDERFTQPGHSLVNLSTGLRSDDGRYALLLWAKNLGNKTYRTSTYSVDAFQTMYQAVNAPRMVGLELRVSL